MSEAKPELILVPSNNKSRFRKPKLVPANYDSIDKWKMPEIKPEHLKAPFLEESSFATLFPKYREKYIREVFSLVQKELNGIGVKAELDLLEGSMTVRTTHKTFDPYAIIKARDIIKLLARSVPYQVALRLLDENTYCDIIKIKSFCRNKEKFVKRRQRLIGPNGDTLKALEILTECYIMVQGSTVSVIGHYKRMKVVRRVIEDVMKNIHPVYYIKELMIKKELEKDETLKNENWDRFLPQFKNLRTRQKKIKKKAKKERKTFPEDQPMRKEDIAMETGEYFLTEKEKTKNSLKERREKQKAKKAEKDRKRAEQYNKPDIQQERQKKDFKASNSKNENKEVKGIIKKFKVDAQMTL